MVKKRNKPRARALAGTKSRASAMQLLWSSPAAPSRGPKPALSLESIVGAALVIADDEGLSALTMARVAQELEVTTMATYRYIPSKEELIDLMIDAAFADPPAARSGNWRRDLEGWARAELARLQARPWMIETVLKRVAIGPNWTVWLDVAFAALDSTPLRTSEKFAAIVLIDGHVRAAAQIAVGATGEWQENFSQVLASAVTDPRYQALGRALQDATQEPQRNDADMMIEQFEFGLERILDGIQSFIDSQPAPRASRASPGGRRSSSR
jgi:AcrR family transcriptional regulator